MKPGQLRGIENRAFVRLVDNVTFLLAMKIMQHRARKKQWSFALLLQFHVFLTKSVSFLAYFQSLLEKAHL